MQPTVKAKSLENVDWDRMPRVQGRVEAIDKLPEAQESRRFIIVDSGTARFRVFESFALQDLFASVSIGDGVDILHLGKAELAAGRSIRRFRYTVYDGATYSIPTSATDDPATPPAK